jgi:LmbE family N-acetylglucosaminyl deacetylase
MPQQPLRLLILGAHPDDAEYHAGGLAAIYCQQGHTVKMVSVTNGAAGHHVRPPEELARVRRAEAAAAGERIGAIYEVWDHPDGELQPTLEVRRQIIREIRRFAPDLVLTHRTSDYHPDHRAVGQCVQDASFMVTVPKVVPEVPALRKDPVVAYLPDLFTRPSPLAPDVVVDVTGVMDALVAALACHVSQFFEWLPWLGGVSEQVPKDPNQRLVWLREFYGSQIRPLAERYRSQLVATYGPERGKRVEYAEVFEISEYGSRLDEPTRKRLFPFVP